MNIYTRVVKTVAVCILTMVGASMPLNAQPVSEGPEVFYGKYQCLSVSLNDTITESFSISLSSTVTSSASPFCSGPKVTVEENNCPERREIIRQMVESENFGCVYSDDIFSPGALPLFYNLRITCQSSKPALNSLIYKICAEVQNPQF